METLEPGLKEVCWRRRSDHHWDHHRNQEASWVVEAEIGPFSAVTGLALLLGENWVFLNGVPVSLSLAVGTSRESGEFMLQTHFCCICYVAAMLPFATLLNSILQPTRGISFSLHFFFPFLKYPFLTWFPQYLFLITTYCFHNIKSPRDV